MHKDTRVQPALLGLFVALSVPSACKKERPQPAQTTTQSAVRQPLGPSSLIPVSATMVGHVDLVSLWASPLWANSKSMIEQQPGELLPILKACDLGLDRWREVTIGMDVAAPETKRVAIVVIDGLGTASKLACVEQGITRADGKPPWIVDADGKRLRATSEELPFAVIHVMDANTVAFVASGWVQEVERLSRGEGSTAADGALQSLLDRVDTTRPIWFAGQLPPQTREWLGGGPGLPQPKDVAGQVDLADGLAVKLVVGLDSAQSAEQAKAELGRQLEGFKPMMAGMGVPPSIVDSVRLAVEGNAVAMQISASNEELTTLLSRAKPPTPRPEGADPP